MKFRNVVVITMLIVVTFAGTVLAADRVSLGFIYGTTENVELVDRTNGAINQVSPTCLDLTIKGNLMVTSALTHEFVDAMHERGIIVTPFLSNHWARNKGKAALKNMEKLTNQIAKTVMEYNLDGINVDIENLTSKEKDDFTEFVKLLREKLPEGKLLSVSVAANPEGKDTGWQGSYDYEKLGEYSDYLFVMAYDEHSQGGACGPVASLEFVENSIKYALQYVSKDKIVLGIPLYGRYWKDGEDYGGEAVVIGAVPSLISKNKGVVRYDEAIGEASVKFSINNPKIKSKINGVTLENGNYTIWYQTEASIKAKLNLVNKYDLLGAGVWALGQEKVDVWEYYKNEQNKIPYESPEEVRIREEYEALVVDMSMLEEPNLFPLTFIKETSKEFKTTNNEANKNKNTQVYDNSKILLLMGFIKINKSKNNDEEKYRVKFKEALKKVNVDFKNLPIQRFTK